MFTPPPLPLIWSFHSRQVLVTLDHLERVSTFQEFVQIFSQFGNEMVEFAHLTGDRQNVSGLPMHAPLLWVFRCCSIITVKSRSGLCVPAMSMQSSKKQWFSKCWCSEYANKGIDLDCGAWYVYTMNLHANSEQINNSSLKCLHKKTNMASLGNSCHF